ncbi:MAG: AAA family ATPase [Butyrivibrio sp.]|nr:AAA family ATPase [Butyrivibrio sp.]
MGIYLNPGNENFRRATVADIYVDKTMLISEMNRFIDKANNYVCVSRPRRFGKTITGNMLAAYYSKGCDSRALFSKYKIAGTEDFDNKLNKYNVIQIDVNSEYQNTNDKDNLVRILSEKIIDELKQEYNSVKIKDEYTLGEAILAIYAATQDTFILLIDEYDVLVREKVSKKLFDDYLSFLNGLFKSNTLRPAISLAYITGILPVVRDKIQSKLNNFREYTFINSSNLTEFIGFTSSEVKKLCDIYQVDYEECKAWYDGYKQRDIEIYNPESVVKCLEDKQFEGYWSKTSSYQVISDRLSQNFQGTKDDVIKMLAGEKVDVNVTGFLNTLDAFVTKDDVFTYLIHLGYLAYDVDEKTCSIPNREVRQEWLNALASLDDYTITNQIINNSKQLLQKTLEEDAKAVEDALDVSHIHVTSNRSYNNEDALQSAIYLAYIYALNKYTVVREMTAGKGFADVVFIPRNTEDPALIIELKRNKTAESALDQIKDKRYFESLELYKGKLLFVGINYDETSKKHSCVIEQFVKE